MSDTKIINLFKKKIFYLNRSLGKKAHFTRVVVTNYLADINIDRMIDYREAAADLEFGRQLTAYVALNL